MEECGLCFLPQSEATREPSVLLGLSAKQVCVETALMAAPETEVIHGSPLGLNGDREIPSKNRPAKQIGGDTGGELDPLSKGFLFFGRQLISRAPA